ncbi:GNAT family N-acetyltransferase [Photobacterium sanguinicancri]|uniref:GNAT family N-acetyltransferase n=1 Tax=Photobacterium sanguinicancri TaxID=875932 RepID=UPI0021C2A831|nr:GNAT family N-acetyltransferase [Photobacterium sanguinicancri]
MDYQNQIECEWLRSPSINEVKDQWLALEPNTKPNPFISWCWIGPWLETFVDDFWLLTACNSDQVVGLGIFTVKQKRNWLGQSYNHYSLHRLGDEQADQIWIEYNDFLLECEHEAQIREAMFSAVKLRLQPRDCLSVGASREEVIFHDAFITDQTRTMLPRTVWQSSSYFIDFKRLNSNGQTLDESLSKSARKQIRRSIKKYERSGSLKVHTADSCEKALILFEQAKHRHMNRWGGNLGESGFANPEFVQFHQAFIRHNFSKGMIQIHRVTAGESDLGIIYNFHFGGVVYFYLSALSYSDDPQLKPGLVAHYLLIEQALAGGMKMYDFMGGEARYKQTFSNNRQRLSIIEYHQPHFALSLQNMARSAKRLMVQSS